MTDALVESVITAGYSESDGRWNCHRLWKSHIDVLDGCADEIASPFLSVNEIDYVVALRASGLALGTLVAKRLNLPLLWFTRPSVQYIFPRYTSLRNKNLLVVDSHTVTGGNLARHISILRELGAHIYSVAVILDCDGDGTVWFRDPFSQASLGHLTALWSWSSLCEQYRNSSNHVLAEIVSRSEDLKTRFWRTEVTEPFHEVSKPIVEWRTHPPSETRINVPLIDETLGLRVADAILSRSVDNPSNVYDDAFMLISHADLVDECLLAAHQWWGDQFDTILAISYWGVSFATLIAQWIFRNEGRIVRIVTPDSSMFNRVMKNA